MMRWTCGNRFRKQGLKPLRDKALRAHAFLAQLGEHPDATVVVLLPDDHGGAGDPGVEADDEREVGVRLRAC